MHEWAQKLDVDVRSLMVRPMKNKWVPCSTSGHLNFNVELLNWNDDVSDYVIVHELMHFSVPNHGKLWKIFMVAHLGDYQSVNVKRKLNRAAS